MKNFLFSIFMVLATSACSTMEFGSSGREVFKVATHPKSEKVLSTTVTKDFFFWGQSPEHPDFDFQDEVKGLGAYNPSFVSIEQRYSFKDIFFTFLTLGLYCPVTYEVTLLSNGELK